MVRREYPILSVSHRTGRPPNLCGLNVIGVSIDPVRKKDYLWSNLPNHGSDLFTGSYSIHKVAVRQIEHCSALYAK